MSRLAGLAAAFDLDPLEKRWLGLDVSDDEPWWATRIRGWLAMYRQIMEGIPGSKISDDFKTMLEQRLETEPPSILYAVYDTWASAIKAEAQSAKSKRR